MKNLLLIMCFCLGASFANAQGNWNNESPVIWEYGLTGERAATPTSVPDVTQTEDIWHKTGTTGNRTVNSDNGKPQWFPEPSGAGSTIQVRTTASTIAKYTLIKKNGDSDYSSLKIDATNGFNKFIIRDIDTAKATAVAKYSFTLETHYKDEDGNTVTPLFARTYHLVFGSNATGPTRTTGSGVGSMFRGGAGISTAEVEASNEAVFTTFRLAYTANNSNVAFTHRKVTKKYTTASGTALYNDISDPKASFKADGTSRYVELYCNNSATDQYYTVGNTISTVKSQTFHLWMDGNKIGEYDIASTGEAPISKGKPFDTFMVYTTGTGTSDPLTEIGYGSIELSDFKVDYVSTTSETLPVTLVSFNGNYSNNTVKLNWKTLSEKDNSHFEVLRSGDGISFNEVARVQGQGNSVKAIAYTATDSNPLEGVNYYKLRQVDKNGEYTDSEVIAVNTSLTNPSLEVVKKDGALGVSFHSVKASAVNIFITDMNGRKIYTKLTDITLGNNYFDIPAPVIPGIYVLSIESKGKIQSVKFLN